MKRNNYRKNKTRKTGKQQLTPARVNYMISKQLDQKREFKHLDTEVDTTVYSSQTPVRQVLNVMSQGTSVITRIGDQIILRSVEYHFILLSESAAADDYAFRVDLVYDRQPNGVTPTLAEIYTDTTLQNTTLRNLDNRRRFTILKTHRGMLNNDVASAEAKALVNGYRKLNHKVQYQTNAGTIADITTGALLLVHVVRGGTASYKMSARIRFTDS